jgi:hypothetical protein
MSAQLNKLFSRQIIPTGYNQTESQKYNWTEVYVWQVKKRLFGRDMTKNVYITSFPLDLKTFHQYHQNGEIFGDFIRVSKTFLEAKQEMDQLICKQNKSALKI